MGNCNTNRFEKSSATYYKFIVDSSSMEWSGTCQSGNCKACFEGQTRCAYERSKLPQANAQICAEGEWVSTAAYNQQKPALNVQSRALIAIAVMVGVCFLALLGVIAAVIMSK
jgi:hypothetical protein